MRGKETKERSLGETPFTMVTKITKTASPKKKAHFRQKWEFNRLYKSPLYILLGRDLNLVPHFVIMPRDQED